MAVHWKLVLRPPRSHELVPTKTQVRSACLQIAWRGYNACRRPCGAMVQHALDDFISNAHLAKTGCERASQVMSADIENPIVAWSHTHGTLCPSWRDAISDLLQYRTTTAQPLNTGREVTREQIHRGLAPPSRS